MSPKRKPQNHDEYIESAADFAKPILEKLRKVMQKACPAIEESMKWSSPCFEYQGLLASMAAFKAHVNFVFFRGKEIPDPDGLFGKSGRDALEIIRLESLKDVPSERVLKKYIKAAMDVNESKVAARAKKKPAKKANSKKADAQKKASLTAPEDLEVALKKNRAAAKTFQGFSPSNQKEYIEWIEDAKRPATREKRIVQAVEWMAEGKPRNWKYMKNWS